MGIYTNKAIEEYIQNNDLDGIRGAIGTICYTDRSFESGDFLNAIDYVVKEKKIDIMQEYDHKGLVSAGKDQYSHEDFGDAVFYLKKNFCNERIKDVMKIGKSLYKENVTTSKKQTSYPNGTSPKQSSHQSNKMLLPSMVLVAIVIIFILVMLSIIK